jgi:hypothetical protein
VQHGDAAAQQQQQHSSSSTKAAFILAAINFIISTSVRVMSRVSQR